MHVPRRKTIVGVNPIDSDRSEWYLVRSEQVLTNSVAQAPYCYESVFLTLRSKTNHLGAFRAFLFSLEECTRSFRLTWEGSVLCLTCV